MRYVLLVVILSVYASVVDAAPRTLTLPAADDTLLTQLADVGQQSPEQVLLRACTLGLHRIDAKQQDTDVQDAAENLGKQNPKQRKESLEKLKGK